MTGDTSRPKLYILDYGAGNVRSLANSITKLGYDFEWIKDESDFDKADKLVFPGVGSFYKAAQGLEDIGMAAPLKRYIQSGKPYFGICIGMQVLFESSEESTGAKGLGIVPYPISKFDANDAGNGKKSVPHMGWNGAWRATAPAADEQALLLDNEDYYFVHSFAALRGKADESELLKYAYTLSRYGNETFVSSIRRGNVFATQFHPEKSGPAGLDLLRRWLDAPVADVSSAPHPLPDVPAPQLVPADPRPARAQGTGLTSRIVACLDVRSNDQGDLVVTKGDQYDVREKEDGGNVRNLGKPVSLAGKYYRAGADEVCFLNITSFRSSALQDQPMLDVVRASAETVFVPLTVGGGIKDTVDPDGTARSALEVAGAYFRAGADKVSIGSEAVINVQELLEREARGEPALTGKTGIETISKAYGAQAVVVSFDPKRVYYDTTVPNWIEQVPEAHRACLVTGETSTTRTKPEEQGKAWWYQSTISGGRDVRDIDVIQLAKGVERLGAGELLINSVDRDGSGKGFDLDLIRLIRDAVSIPVVASSGAGSPADFEEVFVKTGAEAALAAGIFHRDEVGIDDVKAALETDGLPVRRTTLAV
ncbi:Histidine biosynthesis bifunctional protein hisB [Vanrija albida]|uniref:Imidazole glycerol phosphate synthase hisHF n=1 Tax=Vanrija albida TaxID=181172 RepID=A0ABR3Q582_9TREE